MNRKLKVLDRNQNVTDRTASLIDRDKNAHVKVVQFSIKTLTRIGLTYDIIIIICKEGRDEPWCVV